MALPERITVEDFFRPPERAGASISPDGTRIAYLAPWKNSSTSGSRTSTGAPNRGA